MTSEDAASAPQPSAAVTRPILPGPGTRAWAEPNGRVGRHPGRDDAAAARLGARTPGEGDARPLVAAPIGDDTLGDTDEELPVPPRTIDRP